MNQKSHKEIIAECRLLLDEALVYYEGKAVGMKAANDETRDELNYGHVFTRDFAVAAIALLLDGKFDTVKNFLEVVASLQGQDVHMDCYRLSHGMMPASFTVKKDQDDKEHLEADFGDSAIARVVPLDAPLWWLYVLRIYKRVTGDEEFVRSKPIQACIERVLNLYLTSHFEMLPTLLVPDGCYMIDRRLAVYGHPIDMQVLFIIGLRSAFEVIAPGEKTTQWQDAIEYRIGHLAYHLRSLYWFDHNALNQMYRYGVEEFGEGACNKFNLQPDSIPGWVREWMPKDGGYFLGNLGPGRCDFRWFAHGNLLSILSGLTIDGQTDAILQLLEDKRDTLLGDMPIALVYPAFEGEAWRILTGSDLKNTPWSYHNGGHWPFLLWILVAAAIKGGKPSLVEGLVESAAASLQSDSWPEYYDGTRGQLIGKEARFKQTWSIAGVLIADLIQNDTSLLSHLCFEETIPSATCTVDGTLVPSPPDNG